MRNKTRMVQWFHALALGCMGVGLTGAAFAQEYTNIVIETFDDVFSELNIGTPGGSSWAIGTIQWNGSEDATGNGGGSLSIECTWTNQTEWGWEELQLPYPDPIGVYPGRSVVPYYTFEFDVKVDTGSSFPDLYGDYGFLGVIFQGYGTVDANDGGANWVSLGTQTVPVAAGTDWQHISMVLTPFQRYNLNNIVFNPNGQRSTNTVTYLIDNLEIKRPTGPPPALSMTSVGGGGLNIVTSGGTYTRENIRTVGTNYTWYGVGEAVTYSFTIAENPPEPYTGYQTHMLLVADAPASSVSSPDWNAATVLRFDVNNAAGGAGTGALRYKTNSPNSNGGYYLDVSSGGGQYPAVPSTSVVGTWSITFNQNTNVTVQAPDGTSSNYVLTAEAAAFFNAADLRVYYGAMANQGTNVGQKAVLSTVSITGAGGGVFDNFPGPDLNAGLWEKSAANPDNIFILTSDVAYELSWPHPDNLFKLATGPDLTNLTNSDLSVVVGAGVSSVNVPTGYPAPEQGFFELVQRPYTQLQVLLPGETAAPGTVAGKTGTPIAQAANVPFEVVVNAVDDNWNLAFSTDEMYLEGSDTNNFDYVWAPQLVRGSYTYSVTNAAAASGLTIKVLDNDNTNISAVVSSPYDVN